MASMSTLRGCFRQARFGADQRLSERPRVLAAIDQQVLTGAGDNGHVNALAPPTMAFLPAIPKSIRFSPSP